MISIIIPVYEMAGRGVEMLSELIDSIGEQKHTPHEIIVTDDSRDQAICEYCLNREDIKYVINPGYKGAASNFNNGLLYAMGDIIKPMFQDDQFLDPYCLRRVACMAGNWCVLTSHHSGSDRGPHNPYPNEDVYELARGCNTFGSPSAVAWKRNGLIFDDELKWLFDCDFYARMVQQYGQPEFIDTTVLIREWDGMATRSVADGGVRIAELAYIEEKFAACKLPTV